MNKLRITAASPKDVIPFKECRAKTCPDGSPGTYVFDHCRYAGYVAEGLLDLLPATVRNLLSPETPFLVSLHDVGKVSPGFEGKYFICLLRDKAPSFAHEFINGGYVTNHASIGAKALLRLFGPCWRVVFPTHVGDIPSVHLHTDNIRQVVVR